VTDARPYEVLGCRGALAAAAIKSAYRKLAKKHHPDSTPTIRRLRRVFPEINSANEIVGDEEKRKAFDRGEIDAKASRAFRVFRAVGLVAPAGAPVRAASRTNTFRSATRAGPADSPARAALRTSSTACSAARSVARGRAGGQFVSNTTPAHRPRSRPQRRHDRALEKSINGARTRAPADRKELNVKVPAGVTAGQQIRLKGQAKPRPAIVRATSSLRLPFAPHPFFSGRWQRLCASILSDHAL